MTSSGRYYRCDACAIEPERCESCRGRRRLARAALVAAHVARGQCNRCAGPAIEGTKRCAKHTVSSKPRTTITQLRAELAQLTTENAKLRRALKRAEQKLK